MRPCNRVKSRDRTPRLLARSRQCRQHVFGVTQEALAVRRQTQAVGVAREELRMNFAQGRDELRSVR